MSKKNTQREASRRYHDRVAGKYDMIYDDDYWEFHDRVTWLHMKNHLPKELSAPVMDLGCGTGKWGFKLLKAGYPTTFSDLSGGMLAEVQEKLDTWKEQPDLAARVARVTVQQADAVDLRIFPADTYELVTAMGDVVSICPDPARCLSEIHRILKPGGQCVFTVDNQLAAIDHFVEKGSLEAMSKFLRQGKTHWLTDNKAEQFEVHMFTPASIEQLVQKRGFEVVSKIGKTIIPARRNRKLFDEENAVDRLVDLELLSAKDPSAWARASHLQLAIRKLGA